MTTRDTPFAPGTPCWVDLLSSDVVKAKAFYGGLFGWTSEDAGQEFGGYVNFFSDGLQVAGMMPNNPGMRSPDVWTTYISTDDIEATVATATAGGATVLSQAMQVQDLGWMAVISDPVGAVVGLWQPGRHTGFRKYNEPGSVTWDEHHSKDFATSTPFYASTFGWTIEPMSDTDEFRYSTGKLGEDTVVGLMDSSSFLPDQVPSHWAVYFSVESADASIAKLVELGGTVVRPAEDTAFGRMADVSDPTGAVFKLHQAPAGDA